MMKILHDPGHGGSNMGTTVGDMAEKSWTLDFSRYCAATLSPYLVQQHSTRLIDEGLSLESRGQIADSLSPDVVISHHVNAGPSNLRGLMCFAIDDVGMDVGSAIMRAAPLDLLRQVPQCYRAKPKSWTSDAYAVLRHHNGPAVLVEYGFATQPEDLAVLMSDAGRFGLAVAVMAGVARLGASAP